MSQTIGFLFAIILILLGVIFTLLDLPSLSAGVQQLVNNVGLAFIVAGIDSIFRQLVALPVERKESGRHLTRALADQLSKSTLFSSGLVIIADDRRTFEGYSEWMLAAGHQSLFLAGRSVLHRIDINRTKMIPQSPSLADIIYRKLEQGAEISILFLDPRCKKLPELLEKLAEEEKQDLSQIYEDILHSLLIVDEIYDKIKNRSFDRPTELRIGVYDEIPYFAFHQHNKKMYIGFYFTGKPGYGSPVFEAVDEGIKRIFRQHFDDVLTGASILLELRRDRDQATFNSTLFADLMSEMSRRLGTQNYNRIVHNHGIE